MSPSLFTSAGQPAYHAAKLIVKMAPESAEPMRILGETARAGTAAFSMAASNLGLGVLSRFQRAGLIKRAIPLSTKVSLSREASGPGRALVAMAEAAHASAAKDANSRVSLLELENDHDVDELRHALAADPMVEYVSRVPVRYLCVKRKPAPPARKQAKKAAKAGRMAPAAAAPPNSAMWNLPAIKWAEARALAHFTDAAQVKVAVLDTGIDTTHPELQGRIANYVYDHPLVPTASSAKDYIGHGTHVAGTIAAGIGNAVGINGICECQLHIWKIFDDEPDYDSFSDQFFYYVDPAMYHRALAECLDEGIHVVNLSIGGPGEPDQNELRLFEQLIDAGTTVVAAMGNERQQGSPTSYPAAIPGVVAVGATNIVDQVTSFSNRGNHISVCAPGDTIWSTLPVYAGQTGFRVRHLADGGMTTGAPFSRDTEYAAWNGTSMASPHVAAAAALLLAKSPELTPAEVREHLMATADRVPGMGTQAHHPDYGAGRLNLFQLLS